MSYAKCANAGACLLIVSQRRKPQPQLGNPMIQVLRRLWANEDGAEVVEWVIVAAVLIGVAAGG
ncbi:MAG: hypothetical protein VBE63_18475 [Lamprobacter sp.]|uniref:Flp family type IVb pilin n=1 Tax=Lamprobacter sp. TaxID=3100796 RepID=UPI002B263FD5|nr:hypothetical protein [Lamprobacter sp.]MEA3641902.1 hypothetical protein [Lamprobacter sp.]